MYKVMITFLDGDIEFYSKCKKCTRNNLDEIIIETEDNKIIVIPFRNVRSYIREYYYE